MNQIIENTTSSTAKRKVNDAFIIWFLIIAGAILLYVILFRMLQKVDGFFITLLPWVNAGGNTINIGLKLFKGEVPEIPNITTRLSFLISILSIFIIFPTFFFFGLRKRASEKASGEDLPLIRKSTIQFIVGGIVTLGITIPSIPIAIVQIYESNSIRDSQEISTNRDQIINEINEIAWRIYEYRVLPKDLGGGEGSFIGYNLPMDYASTKNGNYQIDLQDDQVLIKGTSKQYSNSDVIVKLSKDGKLSEWSYSGKFELW